MVSEQAFFRLGEMPFGDDTEIGDVLLVFPAVRTPAIAPAAELEGDRAHVPLARGTLPEAAIAGPKNRAEHATARGFLAVAYQTQSITMALRACSFCNSYRFSASPLQCSECPFVAAMNTGFCQLGAAEYKCKRGD
jgi:hypothetical protein